MEKSRHETQDKGKTKHITQQDMIKKMKIINKKPKPDTKTNTNRNHDRSDVTQAQMFTYEVMVKF